MSELENTPSRRGGARPGAGKKKSHPEDKLEQRTTHKYDARKWVAQMKIYCWSYISNAGIRNWQADIYRTINRQTILTTGEGSTQMQAVLNLLARIGGCV
jgi:hypothetical protein